MKQTSFFKIEVEAIENKIKKLLTKMEMNDKL